MNKKLLITIGIILGLAIVVGGFWYVQDNKNNSQKVVNNEQENIEVVKNKSNQNQEQKVNNQETEKPEELDFEEVNTSNWKTYRNEELGFEVKYPKNLIQEEGNNIKGNKSVTYLSKYRYAYFHPNKEGVKNKFLCGTALYVGFYNLPKSETTLEDLLTAKNEYNGDLLPKYKFKNSKKILLQGREFLFSEIPKSFLNAVIIKNNKYYIISMGSDIGGSVIDDNCRNIYLNFLKSFKFL